MQNWNPEKNDQNQWCMNFSNPADNKYIDLDELNKKEEDREYYKSFESVELDWGAYLKQKSIEDSEICVGCYEPLQDDGSCFYCDGDGE